LPNGAIDQLLEEGYLPEFFGRKELRDMFAEVFSYDQELIDKGIEQGAHQKAVEMAKSLLGAGMSESEVAEHSKLSLNVISSIA